MFGNSHDHDHTLVYTIHESGPEPQPNHCSGCVQMNLQKIYLNIAEVKPSCVLWHVAEIGVQDFVKSIKGVEAHADKVAQAIDGVPTLLQTRSSRLKKLGIPCKQVGPVSFPALCISV